MFCTNCGHRNRDDARFCANCGTSLQDDTTLSFTPIEGPDDGVLEGATPQNDLKAGQALLVVKRGPNAGSTFLIDRDLTTVGRFPKSDIFLDDVTVSRRHVEIIHGGDGYVLKDVGSLNGTYLNRERIEAEARLQNGDELQIGKFKLVFFSGTGGED